MIQPNDSGPIYKETILDHAPIIEPWNTFSNLLFLAIVIYWGVKIYPELSKNRFLSICIPILFIGFVGGSVYHGSRSHEVWLLMDWIPIAILSFSVSIYYSIKNRFPWYGIIALTVIPFVTSRYAWGSESVPLWLKALLGYPVIAFVILFPLFFYLNKSSWKGVRLVILALVLFVIAVLFRSIDNSSWDALPMGTHWLWHIFGALASHFLIAYIYQDKAPTANPEI